MLLVQDRFGTVPSTDDAAGNYRNLIPRCPNISGRRNGGLIDYALLSAD